MRKKELFSLDTDIVQLSLLFIVHMDKSVKLSFYLATLIKNLALLINSKSAKSEEDLATEAQQNPSYTPFNNKI